MTMTTHHSLRLEHRPPPHVHRWRAHCDSCDWTGVATRRQKESEEQYRAHCELSFDREHVPGGRPRVPTPSAELPPELR